MDYSCCFVLLFYDMQECVALEELYLSHNGIAKMEGLSTLVNLRVLDVSSNKLTEINDIENLTKCVNQFNQTMHYSILLLRQLCYLSYPGYLATRLEDLWLNDNQITSLDNIAEAVAGSRENLTTIYLERNPCVCTYTSSLSLISSINWLCCILITKYKLTGSKNHVRDRA